MRALPPARQPGYGRLGVVRQAAMVTLGALSLLTIGARLSAAEPLRPPVPVVRPPAAATPPARTVRVATARVVPASPRASAARITSARPPAARDTARRAEPARTTRPAARQAARPVGRVAARPERAPDPAPAASGPSVILAALDAAARASGVEHEALAAMAWRESRFDPRARNPASSARGLMQFTEDAWLEAVRDHGAAHGLARQAARLSTNPETGAISARTPLERERLLARRHEPALAAALAGARTAAARPGMEAALRRPMAPADLYAVHMLGTTGARRFLTELAARPDRRAADVVGEDAVARNRSVFQARNGRAYSLREVHQAMEDSIGQGRVAVAALAARAAPFQEVAEARAVLAAR